MEQTEDIQNTPPFDEEVWIRLIFLLSDTQYWLTEMVMGAVMQVPTKQRKNLFRRGHYRKIKNGTSEKNFDLYRLAESKRFELLIPFRVYTLSRRAPSTTRTTLRKGGKNTISRLISRIFFEHFL